MRSRPSLALLLVPLLGLLPALSGACKDGADTPVATDAPDAGMSDAGAGGGSGGGGTGGAGGGSAGAGPEPLGYPVDAPGPFTVGHRTIETTYDAPGGVGSRTIVVHLWYPSHDATGTPAKYHKVFSDPDVFEGASLAPPAFPAGYPVHVFSHGDQGFAGNASDQAHYFATHGWVYAAPDHEGNLLGQGSGPHPLAIYFERPLDVRASLDALRDLPASDELAGKVDLAHVLMSGHSFGTFTAWTVGGSAFDQDAIRAACAKGDPVQCSEEKIAVFGTSLAEPRALAVIAQAGGPDPDFFGASGYDAARVPYFVMSGTDDGANVKGLYDEVTGVDLTYIAVKGGCHQLFGLGDCPMIANDVGYPIVNAYDLAFARYHVWGDRDPLVTGIVLGTHQVSDLVTYLHKGP